MTHLRLKRICSNNAIQLTGAAALAFKKRSQACERWILKSPFFNESDTLVLSPERSSACLAPMPSEAISVMFT